MSSVYHTHIRKDAPVSDDLRKRKAVEIIEEENSAIPEWQIKGVRKRVKEIEEDPSILIDEDVVFTMLKND